MQRIIDLSPVEPARIGFRQARGVGFNCDFYFRRNNQPLAGLDLLNPQLVFRPRSDRGTYGYDLDVLNPVGGMATLAVPGATFQDPHGYGVEMYFRDTDGRPIELAAYGAMAMTGSAYEYVGPLGPLTVPTGPAGPTGPQGIQGPKGDPSTVPGPRGSLWFNGTGAPTLTPPTVQDGDQYLDGATGDVYRFDGGTLLWARL